MNRLILSALNNRFLTIVAFLVLCAVSVVAMYRTPMDALPDLSENQVIVMTEWSGQNPQNIEDQVTYPITVGMQGLAGVRDVRAMSQMGVSMVTVIFEDNIDIYFARDRVNERLSLIRRQLPPEVVPVIGPDATGLGQIFMYNVESENHALTELRSIQDFHVRYALQSLPDVAEVASVGGYVKSYQIVLDPVKVGQFGVSLQQVMAQIKAANNNVSGKVVDTGKAEIAIQGSGFFDNPQDIALLVVGAKADGSPLLIEEIGEVRISGEFRRGILADAKGETVGGIVVMRSGKNPLEVIERVTAKIDELNTSLPDGVTVVPFYDRTSLIRAAIATLQNVLWQELLITAIVLGLFLWHLGSTIIVSVSLVCGALLTFLFMYLLKVPLNIMSLGGIAIAIGTMVDAAIVVTENAYQKMSRRRTASLAERVRIIRESTLEVGTPIIFAIFIIILSFLPIFFLQGMEGKLFRPLAFTNMFAMLGALIAALFLVPTLCVYFLRGRLKQDDEIPLVHRLQQWYQPLLTKALIHRRVTLGFTLGLLILGGVAMTRIGSEFMPPLDEGAIMYMPMTVPDVSERRAEELLVMTNRILAGFPEVAQVVGKAGRADTATDPAPLAMLETFITLKPKSEWRPGITKPDLIREMNRAIRIDNLWNGFTQPIIGRIDMLSTGIRAQVGIKFFGDDSVKLEELAINAEKLLGEIPGATGAAAIRTMGLRYLDITFRDDMLAQHGVSKGDALALVAAGVGGSMVTTTIEGRERYGVELRLKQEYRQDTDDIKSLPLTGLGGSTVLLSSVADIELVDGPAVINSENGVIRAAVQLNVSGRDLVSFIKEAQTHLEENLTLPEGYRIEFAGQYENQLRAKQRLAIIVPLVLLTIFLFLFITYKDFGLVSIVFLSIPLGLVGGVLALLMVDYNFSVAVWVGFIALFGNVVETGMVILVYLESAFRKKFNITGNEAEHEEEPMRETLPITKQGIHEAVMEGATKRLRPILMTAFTSVVGLLPLLFATGVGAEVQKPLALVVVSGLFTSILLTLIVLPVLFAMLRERQAENAASQRRSP